MHDHLLSQQGRSMGATALRFKSPNTHATAWGMGWGGGTKDNHQP